MNAFLGREEVWHTLQRILYSVFLPLKNVYRIERIWRKTRKKSRFHHYLIFKENLKAQDDLRRLTDFIFQQKCKNTLTEFINKLSFSNGC